MAPADFAQNMDLVTERSTPKTTVGSLTSLFGPVVAPCISQSLGAATAADQAAIEKAAKWYRGAAGNVSKPSRINYHCVYIGDDLFWVFTVNHKHISMAEYIFTSNVLL